MLRETGPDGDRIHLSADGTPLALVNNGAVYYLHPDRLGTVQRITDASKQVVWSARYEPFGQAVIGSSIEYNPRFPGQYYDAETGLYYNHFRDYDSGVGRYVESDPIGLGGGVNTYAYVGDNPLNWVDLFGLDWHHIFPQQFWRRTGMSDEVKRLFDGKGVETPIRHGFSGPHWDYNKRAGNLFKDFCEKNKISNPDKMTRKQAEDFMKKLERDTEITRFNKAMEDGTPPVRFPHMPLEFLSVPLTCLMFPEACDGQ